MVALLILVMLFVLIGCSSAATDSDSASKRTTAPKTENAQKAGAQKAYADALAWYFTGDVKYEENSIAVLNLWGKTISGYSSADGQDLFRAAG